MEKFNLKKAILENKATFFSSLNEGDLVKNIGKGLEYEATEEMIRDYADRLLGAGVDDVEDLANYYLDNPEELPEPMEYEFFKNNYDDILSLAMTGLGEGKKEYYKDAEADDAEHIKALEKDMEDDKKSSKMKTSELKAKIKEMVLAEMNVDVTDDTAAYDFLAEADEEVAVDDTEVAVDGEENIDVDTTTEVDPNVKAVQDALTQAQAAAQKLGDPKLTDQIGNTITFFTRAHVVDKGAVAEGEEPLEEALNKDIKTFAQDLGKRLTDAGFKVKYVNGTLSTEDMKQLKSSTGLVAFETDQNPSQQSLYLNFNPKEVNKIETILDKFQLSPYNGKVMTKGWTSKQVQGAINPGDIFKIDSDKLRGLIQFFRLAKVDTAVKSVNESMFPMLKRILK